MLDFPPGGLATFTDVFGLSRVPFPSSLPPGGLCTFMDVLSFLSICYQIRDPFQIIPLINRCCSNQWTWRTLIKFSYNQPLMVWENKGTKIDQKIEQELKAREGQVKRLHKNIQDYKLNDHQKKILQANKNELQHIVEYKFKTSQLNNHYNFPKFSVASSDMSNPDSLNQSTYNLFQQNDQGKKFDEILFPINELQRKQQERERELQELRRRERQFLEKSKENIRKRKQIFDQKKRYYDGIIFQNKELDKKNKTQQFERGELSALRSDSSQQQIRLQHVPKKIQRVLTDHVDRKNTNEQYIIQLIKNFKAKQKEKEKDKDKDKLRSNIKTNRKQAIFNQTDKIQIRSKVDPTTKYLLPHSKSKNKQEREVRLMTQTGANRQVKYQNPKQKRVSSKQNQYSYRKQLDRSLNIKNLNEYVNMMKKKNQGGLAERSRPCENEFVYAKIEDEKFIKNKLKTVDVSSELAKISSQIKQRCKQQSQKEKAKLSGNKPVPQKSKLK